MFGRLTLLVLFWGQGSAGVLMMTLCSLSGGYLSHGAYGHGSTETALNMLLVGPNECMISMDLPSSPVEEAWLLSVLTDCFEQMGLRKGLRLPTSGC